MNDDTNTADIIGHVKASISTGLDTPKALKKLSEEIREQRKAQRLSQSELASHLGCHDSFIAKLEHLKYTSPLPSYARTAAMEERFGMMKGELWELVQEAKTEIDNHKLMQKATNNVRNQANHVMREQSQKIVDTLLSAADLNTEVSAEVREAAAQLFPDLLVALANKDNRAMLSVVVRDMADEERASSE